MLASAVAQFFRLKVVSGIIVFTCSWDALDKVKFARQLSSSGVSASFACDGASLDVTTNSRFQGVVYFAQDHDSMLEKTKKQHYAHWYKWLVIGQDLPTHFHTIRYDADVTFMKFKNTSIFDQQDLLYLEDVYVHPSEGFSVHPWAFWKKEQGVVVTNDKDRKIRRLDLKKYEMKIVSPVGHYHEYNGTFRQYLMEDIDPQRDSSIRVVYIAGSYILERLNSSEILLDTHSWSSLDTNDSMVRMVQYEIANMAGAVLRLLPSRIEIMDYLVPIWPFRVGFTYLAERESSSNMYVQPFSEGVWWSCLVIGVILAIAQRVTAKKQEEKEGAFVGVLATWLQQDASVVPENMSGRWSFLVVSVAAMLVHAYYTSAIVSSLMSTGMGGPETLRALGDSKYAIASEDLEYFHYLFWDVKTNWTDLEYLKKKKMTSKFYVDMQRGVELIKGGSTAYHTEFNQIFPLFNTFTDAQACKLQYVDTVAEQLAWITGTKRSQYTDVFRSSGAWLLETGLAHREINRLRMKPPPCRASLLAERVKFGDVAPLLALTALGGVLSFIVLGIEVMYASAKQKNNAVNGGGDVGNDTTETSVLEYDYVN